MAWSPRSPDFALGATFVVTWMVPDALGRRMVAYLMGVMLLEFVIIHSSGFMGVVWLGDKTRGPSSDSGGSPRTNCAPLPAFGLTQDVVAHQRLPGAGLPWTDEPQRVIAAGYLYFMALALSEITDFAWVFRWLANARRRVEKAGGIRSL